MKKDVDITAPDGYHWDGGVSGGVQTPIPMLVNNETGQKCGCLMAPGLGLFQCDKHQPKKS